MPIQSVGDTHHQFVIPSHKIMAAVNQFADNFDIFGGGGVICLSEAGQIIAAVAVASDPALLERELQTDAGQDGAIYGPCEP